MRHTSLEQADCGTQCRRELECRYEQGVLLSIRPFLHRAAPPSAQASSDISTDHEEKVQAGEKGALVSSALTAEGADSGLRRGEDSDIFSGPLNIQWAQVSYVLFRDQVRAG